ncbi:MAG: hypothetical protein IPO29_13720 [Anaerolineae bacterium]|nr:hypothetical protein [Anaerolineae bacterium]
MSHAAPTTAPVITPEMRAQFDEQGYLVVEGVFDVDTDLAPVVADYAATLDALAEKWVAEGVLNNRYAGLSFRPAPDQDHAGERGQLGPVF